MYINTLSLLCFFSFSIKINLLTLEKYSYNDLLLNGFLDKTTWEIYHESFSV